MSVYRNKPIVIEAVQYDGENGLEVAAFIGDDEGASDFYGLYREVLIDRGATRANVGDWIIKGPSGELYPCKPDVFAATYEQVDP